MAALLAVFAEFEREILHDVMEINRQIASLPTRDGSYAYSRAIHVERFAVKDYLHALQEFQAAVVPITEENSVLTPREREVLR